MEQSPDIISGEAEINTIQGGENTWLSDFDPGGGVPGSSIVMDDPVGGSWFVLIGDSNGYANGPEQEVLLAQLTTDGMLSGALYIQVFVEGDGGNIEYLTLEIGGNCYPTDEDCTYPEDLYGADYLDCSGFCLNDTDGDGICDEAEVPGCTDEEACNFNPDATDEDGGCSYLEMFTETFDVSCFGAADGRLILDIQGGIAPFALSISGYPTVTLDTAYFIFEGVSTRAVTPFNCRMQQNAQPLSSESSWRNRNRWSLNSTSSTNVPLHKDKASTFSLREEPPPLCFPGLGGDRIDFAGWAERNRSGQCFPCLLAPGPMGSGRHGCVRVSHTR